MKHGASPVSHGEGPSGWVLFLACLAAATASFVASIPAKSMASPSGALNLVARAASSPTPLAYLPPGAFFPDAGPSRVIYPAQTITLRFDHKKHLAKNMGLSCASCHGDAKTSARVEDRLLPKPAVCDRCHGSNHHDLTQVSPGPNESGACAQCHAGYQPSEGNVVARLVMPMAHLRFNHKAHAERNIGCESCHGTVQELGVATREQLPRMRGCLGCHAMSGPAQGNAKSECSVCHLRAPDGRLQLAFSEGKLLPPRWLSNLEHTADFLERHKRIAADNSQACASCHAESFCTDCHDGRVRPRGVHPNDYLSLHPVEAQLDNPHCASCHQEQQFCLPCHQRSGVAWSSSPGSSHAQGRFHPPARVWSELPRTRQHHAWEAQRNLAACVSCHTERDCALCHATQAAGGRGFNPHPAQFASLCGSTMRKNMRACLVCHDSQDASLAQCR